MERRKLSIFGLLSLAVVSLVGSVASTIAWFRETVDLTPDVVTGSVQGAYYAGGDGTSGNPFQIHDPIHLYNLAWLQYFGLYNVFDNNELEQQYYFVVTADLDMTGWTLPPIGTEDYPFLGKFDGGGHTITGLTSTNDFDSGSGVKTPQKFTGFGNEYHQPQIVGFFGVVGKLPDDTYTYTSANNQMINVTLNGTKVESRTPQTLIGIAAGYVNATMSGVKVSGAATIDVNGATASTAVDSAKITGNLSDYGLVGYTANTGGSSTYQQKLSAYYNNTDSTGTGPGSQDEWGGSINMRSLNNRIWNLLNAPNNVRTDDPSINHPTVSTSAPATDIALQPAGKTYAGYYDYHRYYYDNYNYVSVENAISETRYNNRNPETITNIYRLAGNGTYSNYSKDDAKRKKIDVPGTALPLSVGEKTDGYPVTSRNTGYIVSGMAGGTGSYTGQTTIRVASSPIGGHIGNSLSSSGTSSSSYISSQLEIITTSNPGQYNSSNFTRISDEYNENNGSVSSAMSSVYNSRGVQGADLAKYNAAREQLDGILSGQSFAHGLHFTGSRASASNYLSLSNALINGQTFLNFPLPKNSIDFSLKEKGYINFFAGSYQHNTSTACDSFFSLNVVKRNASNGIASIYEISKIYNNTNDATKTEFPYVYELINESGNSAGDYAGIKNGAEVVFTKGSTIVFDMRYLWNGPLVNYALYYFEIPVNSGEFAMGSHSGKDKGTYLLYLDIGANGEATETDTVKAYSITTIRNGNLYPAGVDFAPVTVTGAGGESMGVSIAASKKGVLTLTVTTSPANIAIADASGIAEYAFQGTKYSATSPPSGYFSMSGNLSTPMVVHPAGGERVLTISLTTVDDDEYDVRITDQLDAEGSIDSSTYELDSGSGYASSSASAIEALSEEIVIADLRALEIAATLTRASGKGEFVTTYDTENCSADTVDVDIALNGTTIGIAVSTGYTFKIGGTEYADSDTYPSS